MHNRVTTAAVGKQRNGGGLHSILHHGLISDQYGSGPPEGPQQCQPRRTSPMVVNQLREKFCSRPTLDTGLASGTT
jgi:hypothetical protein